MHRSVCVSSLALVLLALNPATGLLPRASGASPPEQVTTDTLAYCRQLAAQLDRIRSTSANPPAEVVNLAVAGRDLCERGSVRGGILRLRSAIVMLLHPQEATQSGNGE